jgi:hypothetical protein
VPLPFSGSPVPNDLEKHWLRDADHSGRELISLLLNCATSITPNSTPAIVENTTNRFPFC